MSYITNILKTTIENDNFRKVLFTGEKTQLVVMTVPVGGEIGEEIHAHVEQTFYIQSGEGKVILEGKESVVGVGDALVVTPSTRHNIVNTGSAPLKIFTVYAPPNHIDGRVHTTKAEADADTEDEAFGHGV